MVLGGSLALFGCKDDPAPAVEGSSGTTTAQSSTGSSGLADGSSGEGSDSGGQADDRATLTHTFGAYTLAPRQEIQPCIQWTLNNEESIYIQAVTLANDGGYHHSNWFVVPEDLYEGEDGFFQCSERGFTELEAAVQGTVLTAQSTQSRYERMELPHSVVIKAPPHHKVIAGGHMLNLADADFPTELRMSLDIIHPRDVDVVAAPFRLTYRDLDIPPFSESRFTSHCSMMSQYENAAGVPLDLKLYYLLPHYHYLGNYFDLSMLGGPEDGQSVFRLDGFNADANGQAFPQPIDLTGAEGFSFTCGYNNWTDLEVGWGIGDQEMCVMLGLADSRVLMDGTASNNAVVGTEGDILLNESNCSVIGLPKNEAQSMPSEQELDRPLYIPPTGEGDVDLPPVDDCEDVPDDAVADEDASLSRIRDTLFVSSCQFSSCHAGANAVAGLDLGANDLYLELLNHEVQADTGLPLVQPFDPEGSWLYQLISRCEPTTDGGEVVAHMPLNAPTLSKPEMVATVRAWIEAGAPDN